MKTLGQLYIQLKTLGVPVAYRSFDKGEEPAFPYIVYYRENESSLIADNHNYFQIPYVVIELYDLEKNGQLEQALEEILNEHELPFEKYSVYIEEEQMELTGYDISLF